MPIRILLADDHKMLRQALRIPLDLEADMEVVGEAGSGAEVLDRLGAGLPDVVVLDIGLPDISGIDLARHISSHFPGVRVVALSGYTDRLLVEDMLRAGARAFVAKAAGADELLMAIRAVMAGKIFLSPEVAAAMVRPPAPPEEGDPPPASVLGKRELEVLKLLAEGRSSPEIASALGISPATVDVHRRNIRQKLQLNSVADLTRYAIRAGLVGMK